MLTEFCAAARKIRPVPALDAATTHAMLAQFTGAPTSTVLVAEDSGRLQGVVAGIVSPVPFNREVLTAQELFWWVSPEARQGGIGAALLQALEDWARKQGAPTLTVAAFEGLHYAAVDALYRGKGYHRIESHYIKEI